MNVFSNPKAPFQVRMMGAKFQPALYRPSKLGQIQFSPHVEAPITIELGSLPLSIGLFAGSGVSFLVGTQVPSIRMVTTIAGVALAGFGVINLFFPKKKPGEGVPPPLSPVAPGTTSGPLPPTEEEAFAAVTGRVLSPGDYETLDVSPIGTPKIPMRVRLSNGSSVAANFDLTVDVEEQPEPIGSMITAQQTMRIYLAPGETRDFDLVVPINSWDALVDYVEAYVTIRKRRFAGGGMEILASRVFVVE